MVYTSIPAYIDPVNWHQQQQPNHQQNNIGGTSSQLLHPTPPPPLPPSTQQHGASTAAGSIRPGSMADRARMANIPMQEPAQKCPRCESTNTKFCYFNNYSLSQPRHFCKTCRRYWTRGGALRNVPVGGGCRRNKRTKGTNTSNSRSKSPPPSSDRGAPTNSGGCFASEIVGLGPPMPSSLRFMAPLMHNHHQLGDHHFSSGVGGSSGELGLNYSGGIGDLNFHIGSALNGGGGGGGGGNGGSSLLSAAGLDQLRVPQTQQFPFMAGFEASSQGLYQFENSTHEGSGYGGSGGGGGVRPSKVSNSGVISVKMEESNNNNLARQFLGMNNNSLGSNSEHFLSAWTHLSGFSSSSNTTTTNNNPP